MRPSGVGEANPCNLRRLRAAKGGSHGLQEIRSSMLVANFHFPSKPKPLSV